MSKDYDGAKKALDKLIADFPEHPGLPEALCWIAERYAWANRYKEAKTIHQKIIKDYPDSSFVNEAELVFSRADVLSLMMSKKYEKAESALDKLFTDFKGCPDLPKAVLSIGIQCYDQGLLDEKEGQADKAKDHFEKAAKIWDRLVSKVPDYSLAPEAACRAGDCYFKLGKHQDSIRCFQKVVDNYPQYEHAWHAQFTVGRCYEELRNGGELEKPTADAKINTAYKQLIEKYPDCPAAEYAYSWLAHQDKDEKEKQK
jgi:tetratricopeptide (TPR) repeat protein